MPTEIEDSTVKCEPMNGKLKVHFEHKTRHLYILIILLRKKEGCRHIVSSGRHQADRRGVPFHSRFSAISGTLWTEFLFS